MAPNIMLTLLFLAGLLVVYYLAPERARWGILLVASLLFYISADSRMVALVVASAVWSWITGRKIGQAKNKREKRDWLLACILPLLGILFLFKYFDFFSSVDRGVSDLGGAPSEFSGAKPGSSHGDFLLYI